MAPLRTPFQGLWNVVRFNWHFYAAAGLLAVVLVVAFPYAPPAVRSYCGLVLGLLLAPVVVSLVVTAYVYDFSELYRLRWLPVALPAHASLLTVNAGFDEISPVLAATYAPCQLTVLDFYDPARHTEVSIKRARRAYPPYPGTLPVRIGAGLPVPSQTIDLAVAFLAAHEIRDAAERADFFREIKRLLKPDGRVVVTEHLRDGANFLAYTLGFLHFHSRRTWLATFQAAGLRLEQEIRITPFITAFVLRAHDTTA